MPVNSTVIIRYLHNDKLQTESRGLIFGYVYPLRLEFYLGEWLKGWAVSLLTTENTEHTEIPGNILRVLCALPGKTVRRAHAIIHSTIRV